jgi:RHS repeat-associated protein
MLRSFEVERGLTLAIRTADALNLSDTQDLALVWDLVGNLTSRRDRGAARDTTESHTYDAINRLRITSLDGTQTDATTYDAFGNIKSKTGIGAYSYLSTRPHAVTATSSGSKTWSYDANGNMDGGDGRTITYTTHDKPALITKGTTSAAFRYGPGREYYKRVDTVAGVTTTAWFVGATEIVDKSDGTRDIRRSVDGVVEQVLHFNAGGTLTGTDTRYLLRDHLGSITGFMNATAIDQEQAFDAWGRRENVGWASVMTVGGSTWNAIMALTERGFTGHQHVDRLDLIHMNGRTYDPKLGRFMQADIVVQAPANTQSYNRYSYLMNNPLNGTDPSGYEALTLGSVLKFLAWVAAEYVAYTQTGTIIIPLSSNFGVVVPVGGAANNGFAGHGATQAAFGNSAGAWTYPGQFDGGPRTAAAFGFSVQEVVVGDTRSQASGERFANGASTRTFMLSIERNPHDEDRDRDWVVMAHIVLNTTSMAMDASVIGAPFSWVPDLLDAVVSGVEGDWGGVGLSVLSAVPGIGNAANAAKLGSASAKVAARGVVPKPGTRVRPTGVPENWRVRPSDSPGGVKYSDPKNPGNQVRVEQGNPNSPYPSSREPYVRDLRNGQYRDVQGNVVPRNDPAGHIPLDQYPGYRP